MRKILLFIVAFFSGFTACHEKTVPKPYGYYRIEFHEKKYHLLDTLLPYRFEVPDYSRIVPDQSKTAEPYWINVLIPGNKASIHISYKKVENNLYIFTEESRKMAYDHTIKASSIEEEIFLHPASRVYGTIYHIGGNAASPMQFYMTDSIRHFLRGSLYISVTPNIDSLKPVIDFLKTDMMRMIQTLTWSEPK